jgi:hypothetical protein
VVKVSPKKKASDIMSGVVKNLPKPSTDVLSQQASKLKPAKLRELAPITITPRMKRDNLMSSIKAGGLTLKKVSERALAEKTETETKPPLLSVAEILQGRIPPGGEGGEEVPPELVEANKKREAATKYLSSVADKSKDIQAKAQAEYDAAEKNYYIVLHDIDVAKAKKKLDARQAFLKELKERKDASGESIRDAEKSVQLAENAYDNAVTWPIGRCHKR